MSSANAAAVTTTSGAGSPTASVDLPLSAPVESLGLLSVVGAVDEAVIARRHARSRGADAGLARGLFWARLLSDVALLYGASAVMLLVGVGAGGGVRWLAVAFPTIALLLLYTRRSSDGRLNASLLETFVDVLKALTLGMMIAVTSELLIRDGYLLHPAVWLWLTSVLGLALTRGTVAWVRRRTMLAGRLATPTLIVGAGMTGALLARRLLTDAVYGLRPVGFLDADPLPSLGELTLPAIPLLGGPDDLEHAIQTTGARRVILAFSSERDHQLVAKVRKCQELGVDVSLLPRLYESMNERSTLDHIGGLPLLTLHAVNPHGWQFTVKHAVDRIAAFFLLVILAPVMLVLAAAVRRSSPGPILFRQLRIGRDGHEFHLLKFRTMREDVTAAGFEPPDGCAPGGVEGFDRRTRIGTWLRGLSLDELPQLINVLRGDMSLVGPRPERPEFVAHFTQMVAGYQDRHRVKSGITGWAQVHGLRGQTSIADRVEWDNYYIRNWSLRLDLRIAALTVAEIFRHRG